MRIGVIGTGNMGRGLGQALRQAGHDVFMGSRDPEKGKTAGADIGATGGSYADATAHGELLLFAVPWWGVDETIEQMGDVSGKVVVDITNPYKDATYSEMVSLHGSSAGEEVQKKLAGARVVKGWNYIFAQIAQSDPQLDGRPATVFICGDDAASKESVASLARDIGYDPVDAGPLSSARYLESLAGLMITMAYGLGMGPNMALVLLKR